MISNHDEFEAGERTLVAIVAAFEQQFETHLFGHFNFYVGSKKFGDWGAVADLAACARWAKTYLARRDRIKVLDVSNYEGDYLLWRLHGSHVDPEYPSDYQNELPDPHWYMRLGRGRNRFHLTYIGESGMIDTDVVLAIPQPDGTDRVVAFTYESQEVADVVVDSCEILHTLRTFIGWVDDLLNEKSLSIIKGDKS